MTPVLVEIVCITPLIALPFVYWLGNSKEWVVYLVLLHMVSAVLLASVAVLNTGSIQPAKMERFVRYSFKLQGVKKLWCCVGGDYNKIIWFYQLG